MRTITVHDLKELVDSGDPQLVDVRETHEYTAGHVPGAVLIPIGSVTERTAEIDRSQPVYLICAVGGRSAQAAAWLATVGFDPVNVEGGTGDWVGAGYPVER